MLKLSIRRKKARERRALQQRILRRKKPQRGSTVPPNPRMVEQFRRRCAASSNGRPFDPGLSPPGTLRFLLPTDLSYMMCVVNSYDRTLAEWNDLIADWKGSSWFGANQGLVLESLFEKSQRIRWIARKWIRNVRMRILARRTVGLVDLHTVTEIPLESRITIYDYPTRSCYAFHTNTLERILTTSLSYHAYGIASPQAPKNPYTNVPFTLAQNLSILQQLVRTLSLWNRLIPTKLTRWHVAGCSIRRLIQLYNRILQIDAAVTFLKTPSDGEALLIFRECIDDLYEVTEIRGRAAVRAYVKARVLPPELMNRWDKLVLSYWILHNHNIAYGDYKSMDELEDSFVSLHEESHRWWATHPRRIVPRLAVLVVADVP